MARPKKAPEEQRAARVPHARLTIAELALIEREAAAAGLDRAEFTRRRLLGQRVTPSRVIADERLLVEINRIGVNLNQIAKAANLGKTMEHMLAATLDEVRAAMARVSPDGP